MSETNTFPKIDIYVDGHYVASTNKSPSLREAQVRFIANPVVQGADGPRKIDLTYRRVVVKWAK